MFRKILLLLLAIPCSALGSSLILKAGIGTGAWDAVSKSAVSLLNIKIGTFGMCTNILLILIQYLVLKKNFKRVQFLQFGMSILLGNLVNFFYYDFLAQWTWSMYPIRLIFFLIGILINAAAVGIIIKINIITFPVGGFVKMMSDITQKPYGLCRQILDLICICIVFFMFFFFKGEITLREGTILSMILFGPLVDRYMKWFTLFIETQS